MDIEKKFYSKENFLVLKEILNKISNEDFNTQNNKNLLFETMRDAYKSTPVTTNNLNTHFHNINKKVINTISKNNKSTPVFKERKPTSIPQNDNIPVGVNSVSMSNSFNINNKELAPPGITNEQNNPNEMFDELKKNRMYSKINKIEENEENEEIIDKEEFLSNSFENNDLDNLIEAGKKMENKDYYNFDTKNNNEINVVEDVSKYRVNDTNNYAFYPNIKPPRNNQIEKKIIVVINSKDRDLSIYPNSNNFQVKFSPNGDTIEIPTSLNPDGSIKREPATLYKGYKGAVIQQGLKNIKHIRLLNVTVPFSPVYYNGKYPDQFNGQIGTPTINDAWNTNSNYIETGYLPLWQLKTTGNAGIPIDVLNEPYLLVDIDEIDTQQYFRSTNIENEKAFARVISDKLIGAYRTSSFAVFSTYSPAERMTYEPTLLSHIDKMTLHLKTQCNEHLYVGQDKIYVNEISEGSSADELITNSCLDTEDVYGAVIKINRSHPEYRQENCTGQKISGHGLRPGDVVYFYSTKPCKNEFIYNLNSNLTFIKIDSNKLYVYYKKTTLNNGKTLPSKPNECYDKDYYNLKMNNYMEVGDYISYNGELYYVNNFGHDTINGFYVELEGTLTNITSYTKSNIGIVRQNKRGFTDNNPCSLTYKGGHRVTYIQNQDSFVIDIPGKDLNNIYKNLSKYTLFFIKKHLQISYMFEFTTVEKEYSQLKSDLL